MDPHSQDLMEEFRQHVEDLEIINRVVTEQLRAYLDERGMLVTALESRIKTEESLAGKLELKGFKYRDIFDITDLVGARIITLYNHEVDELARHLSEVFEVDWENTVDKRKALALDQFGYMSLHYICAIPEEMYCDPAHPAVNSFRFEVQLRTTLQHAWAAIFHDIGYKHDTEVPRAYLRGLIRLSGLLELADSEFDSIFNGLQEYRIDMRQLVTEGKLGDLELNGDTFEAYLETGALDDLCDRAEAAYPIDFSRPDLGRFKLLIPCLVDLDIATLEDLQSALDTHGWRAVELLWGFLSDFVDEGERCPVSVNILLRAVCALVVVERGEGLHGVEHVFEAFNPGSARNKRQAERLYEEIAGTARA